MVLDFVGCCCFFHKFKTKEWIGAKEQPSAISFYRLTFFHAGGLPNVEKEEEGAENSIYKPSRAINLAVKTVSERTVFGSSENSSFWQLGCWRIFQTKHFDNFFFVSVCSSSVDETGKKIRDRLMWFVCCVFF